MREIDQSQQWSQWNIFQPLILMVWPERPQRQSSATSDFELRSALEIVWRTPPPPSLTNLWCYLWLKPPERLTKGASRPGKMRVYSTAWSRGGYRSTDRSMVPIYVAGKLYYIVLCILGIEVFAYYASRFLLWTYLLYGAKFCMKLCKNYARSDYFYGR